jgi:hypothetical protein
MSVAKQCLAFSGLFEAELLLQLMLRYWAHPLAADDEFRHNLLENAAEVLRLSVARRRVMEDIPPKHMNFVAAVWYVEWSAVSTGAEDPQGQRQAWLDKLRQAIPSCFCPPDRLA